MQPNLPHSLNVALSGAFFVDFGSDERAFGSGPKSNLYLSGYRIGPQDVPHH
jgi:hypothetical protein